MYTIIAVHTHPFSPPMYWLPKFCRHMRISSYRMRIYSAFLFPFVVSSVCEAFVGVPRVSSTLKKNCSSFVRQGIPPTTSLSASGKREQEHKKMVSADDLRSCQVRVRALWVYGNRFTVRIRVIWVRLILKV